MPNNFDFPEDLIMELRSGSSDVTGVAKDEQKVKIQCLRGILFCSYNRFMSYNFLMISLHGLAIIL